MRYKIGNRVALVASAVALVMSVAGGGWLASGLAQTSPDQHPASCSSGKCCGACPLTSSVSDKTPAPKGASGRLTLDPKLFVGPVREAYTVADKNPMLLAQLDCYCGCYKTDGHKSLLDCYRGRHGATCQLCTQEALEADRLFENGMPPEQIKESLRRKYQTAE